MGQNHEMHCPKRFAYAPRCAFGREEFFLFVLNPEAPKLRSPGAKSQTCRERCGTLTMSLRSSVAPQLLYVFAVAFN